MVVLFRVSSDKATLLLSRTAIGLVWFRHRSDEHAMAAAGVASLKAGAGYKPAIEVRNGWSIYNDSDFVRSCVQRDTQYQFKKLPRQEAAICSSPIT